MTVKPNAARSQTWWMWIVLCCPACSVLVGADDKQCQSDADCNARGLTGALCVAEVCQRPPAAPSGSASAASSGTPAQAPAMTGTRDDAVSTAGAAGSAGARPAAGGGARALGGTLAVASAGSPSRAGSAGVAGMAGMAGMAGKPAAGSGAPCMGESCPECQVDADCERRGMPGATCKSATCWPAMPQCKTDDDCVARGPEFMGGKCAASQCLPNPRWRCDAPAVATSSETKSLKVLVRDSLSLNPVANVHVVACQKLDLTCSQPVKDAMTGTDGYLNIELPANFAGYLQQSERRDYSPAMYFLPQVFPADGVLEPFPLLGSGVIIDALAAALGAGIDAKRGHLMLISEDCMGMALSGVTFTSPQKDAQTVQFYVRDLLPSTTATDTAEVGNGGFLNFPAGTAVINVTQPKTKLDLATVSVVVRAGYISVAYIRPRVR